MSTSGLAYTSMFADRPNNFGIAASDYVSTPTNLRLSDNMNNYSNMFGRYTDINGGITGEMPSKASFDAVDVTKAPAVFNEKGLFDWSVNEAGKGGNTGGLEGQNFGADSLKTGADTGGGFMDFLGTDTAKNAIGIGGLALSGFGALNTYKAGKQAKKQWEAENARANEIMAMNREKYNTYKADKAKLNAGYSGLAASGIA